MPRKIPPIALLSLLFLLSAGSAPAQETAEATADLHPLEQAGQELREAFEANRAEAERTRELAEGVSGEDRDVVRRQLEELGVEAMRNLGRQVENVRAREEAGLDTRAAREALAGQLEPLGPQIVKVVRAAFDEITELRKSLEDATPEERQEGNQRLDARIEWLDAALEALLDHVDHLEELGLDASHSRAFLEEALAQRASLLAGRLRLQKDRLASLQERLEQTPDDADLSREAAELQLRLDRNVEGLRATVQGMRRVGLDTTEYRKFLIEATGEISVDVLDREVALSLLRDAWERGRERLADAAPEIAFRVVRFLLVLLVAWLLAALTRRAVQRAVRSSRFRPSQLAQNMVMSLAGRAVLLIGGLVALSQLGIELAPLLAGLGIAGFIVGFALQDSLANFAAGAMILIYRPYDVGDVIDAGGVFGKVGDMSLVSTTLLTFDNQTLVVPNSKIWGDVIKNVTAQKVRRVDLSFAVGHGEDVERVEAMLREIAEAHPKTLEDPPAQIKVHELTESAVVFVVRPWAQTADYWDVYWDLTRDVKLRFARERVQMPFARRDVHLRPEPAEDGREGEEPAAGRGGS